MEGGKRLGLSLLCSRVDLVFFLEIPNNSFPAFSLYSMHHASTFLLRDSSNDFGQHKQFRRLLVVAELLELCTPDSSSDSTSSTDDD